MDIETDVIKSGKTQSNNVHACQYSSPETWARMSGWQVDIRQTEPGVLDTCFLSVACPQVQFHHMQFNRGIHQQGLASKDYLHFGIPNHQQRLLWNRSEVTPGCLINHNSRNGYEVVSDSGLKNFLISVDRTLLEGLATVLAVDCDFEKLTTNNTVYNPAHSASAELLQQLQRFYQSIQYSQGPLPVGVIEDLQSNLPLLLLHLLKKSEPIKSKPDTSVSVRSKGLERALLYINQNAQDAITVQEVCKAASVNWRTLERAFRDQFDTTPKAYLKAVRLNGARKELLSANRTKKVGDIANDWGFWHLSQFSADYKFFFGELPTASLNK